MSLSFGPEARGRSSLGRRARGFTLIEVMIAITVLSVGLLGLAALQVSALQNGKQSLQRTQASALAYDIADRMRANRLTAVTGNRYPDGYSVDGSNFPDAISSTNCSTTAASPCSGAQLAAWDLSNWAIGLTRQLTGGTATIACTAAPCASGSLQVITVMWDEFRTGATGKTCPSPETYDKTKDLACFSVYLMP